MDTRKFLERSEKRTRDTTVCDLQLLTKCLKKFISPQKALCLTSFPPLLGISSSQFGLSSILMGKNLLCQFLVKAKVSSWVQIFTQRFNVFFGLFNLIFLFPNIPVLPWESFGIYRACSTMGIFWYLSSLNKYNFYIIQFQENEF